MTKRPIAKEAHQVADVIARFLKSGDLDGIVSMFHPDCKVYFPPDEAPKQGHDGVREVFKDFVEMKPILISTVTAAAVNGDTGLLKAEWRFEAMDGSLIAEGQSTEVVKQLDNGGWGYFIDCPMGPPALET